MAFDTETSVGRFRSSVQWFLEGNTPSHKVDQIVDLLVALRHFGSMISDSESPNEKSDAFIQEISTGFSMLSRKALEDTAQLIKIVGQLKKLVTEYPQYVNNKIFRSVVVNIIVIAEGHLDLPFRKSVVELAEML